MSTPERVRVPAPTGDAYLDYLEIRIIQALCREVAHTKNEKARQFAFALGIATARWIYVGRYEIEAQCVNPVDYVSTIKGRLTTVAPIELGRLISISPDRPTPAEVRQARREVQEILSVD